MIGQTISHYRILEKLGEGGMGVVFKARDTKLERDIALKFLPQFLTTDPAEKERFYHEARAASALTHPHITVVHEIDETPDGQLFIAMELVEGQTLKQLVAGDPLPLQKVLEIAIQTCEGLSAAHEKGIVHRDIKSDNIMLSPKGEVKIMDFGLAKVQGATKLTKTGSTVGTAAYMSPEQALGEEVDQRSDIFSFGVVLYELLTGRLPFRGDHPAALMYSIINEEPPPAARFNEKVTPEHEHILAKALAKDKDERYQHAGDLLADLRRERKKLEYSRAGYVPAPSVAGAAQNEQKARKRRRGVAIMVLSGMAITAIVLTFLVPSSDRSVDINPGMIVRPLQIPGTMTYPGISGDGNWVVYGATDLKGKFGLYIRPITGGEPRLVTLAALPGFIDVSSDGSMITYVEWEDGLSYQYAVPTNGGTPRKIGPGTSGRFRPDGKRIGFVRGWNGDRLPSRHTEFWSAGIDGSDLRREFVDSIHTAGYARGSISFSYAPDGKKIAWIRSFPGFYGEIIIHDLETGHEAMLTSDKKHIDELAWAGMDRIVYTSDRSGVFNVWTVSASGGTPVQVTKETTPAMGVKCSTNGQRILYQLMPDANDFWIVDLQANHAHQITSGGEDLRSPRFSPDGKKIAFVVGGGVAYSNAHVFVMDRDGRNRRQLSFGDGVVSPPCWSTNGRRLVYNQRTLDEPVDSARVYVVDPLNPESSKCITRGLPYGWIDSVRIQVYAKGSMFVTSADGGASEKVGDDSTLAFVLQGGKYVIFYDLRRGRNSGALWITDGLQPRGTQRRAARMFMADLRSPKGVAEGGRFLYRARGAGEISRLAVPSAKEEPLRADLLGVEGLGAFVPSWDGTEAIIVKSRHSTQVVMIENLFK